MVRFGTPTINSTLRSLTLLEAIIADAGSRTTPRIATECSLPLATAHRIVKTLVEGGFLRPIARGRHIAGWRMQEIAGIVSPSHGIAEGTRKFLRNLALQTGCTAHLGVLDHDMVTYLVKEGQEKALLFTREGSQLEAYCSAVGKALLAHLSERDLASYLRSEPFVQLTPATITDPEELRRELDLVRLVGHAWDKAEVAPNLYCCAVPIRWPDTCVRAAVSVSKIAHAVSESDVGSMLAATAKTAEFIQDWLANLSSSIDENIRI